MDELIFNKSFGPTIGVELEIQILDSETLHLNSVAPEILKKVHPSQKERIKPEFIESMVEINTGICPTVSDVEKDLNNSYKHIEEIAEALNSTLYLTSLHPFSNYSDQKVTDHPRYLRLMNELQLVGRRFITQGLHVHIGVDDKEKVVRVNNIVRIYLPILLALTTSSPFYVGEDTGLMSYRAKLFESLPNAGMPDSLNDWEEYRTLVNLLKGSGVIESVRDIWWDVRPHPDFGTIEVRICDLPYSLRDIFALTALIQALVVTVSEQHTNPEPHIQILRSNKWQAARYGIDGYYIDPFLGERHSMREAALNIYRLVKPAAETLKSINYLDEIPEILNRLTGAHLQRKFYYEGRHSFTDMIRKMKELF